MVAAPRLNRPLMLLAVLIAFPATARAGDPDPRATPLPTIDPRTPTGKLLPVAPKVTPAPVYLGDDLPRVPEVTFEALPENITKDSPSTPEWVKRKARTAAAVLHLNAKEEDGFLKALLRSRPDLAGMPFLMGKECRADADRAMTLQHTSRTMHSRGEPSFYLSVRYQKAHLAVMALNLIGHDDAGRTRALRALAASRHAEATRELARAAVYSPDQVVRTAALEALAKRPASESTDVLVAGLRYPWPAVARNATLAIVELKRTDLIPQLRAVRDEADPRAPRAAVVDGRKVTVAHEVVRINHLRNCMLCHAPAGDGKTPEETLVAEVPLPSEPLPDSGNYFDDSRKGPARLANLLVRIDVTYLRQDFSAMSDVAESSRWPTRQRFDYVVRKRVLTATEADDLRKRLRGESPFRRAAAEALRELNASNPDDESGS
jgi:hypothetical protein